MTLLQDWQLKLGVPADNHFGPRTYAASMAWRGGAATAPQDAPKPVAAPVTAWPRQGAVAAFYGPAGGPDCTAGRCVLPFAFPLAWDGSQRVTQFACHAKVAAALTGIFADAAAHYGETEFRRLRLDQFGGCYNYRPMRGGTALSMHAWGIAVDLDPINNQLLWGKDRAAFARPEYDPFWRIVEAAGATSLGRAKNYDFMHFQFAGL